MHPAELAQLYPAHIDRLLEQYGQAITDAELDALVIHSGVALSKSSFDDQSWPLRVTPAFAHWLPLAEPGCQLIIKPGERPILVRPRTDDYWEGAPPEPPVWSLTPFQIVDQSPALTGHIAHIGDGVPAKPTSVNPPVLLAALDRIRRIKSDYEVACIAEANRIAAIGHRALRRRFAAGPAAELELHLGYLAATHQDDSETPYKNIVAIDRHAAVLHHVRYDRDQVEPGAHSLLVDAGASCLGYASDVTRTTVVGDAPGTDTFTALLGRLETLQQLLCDQLMAGVDYEDLHDAAHRGLARILVELELASKDPAALVERGVTRALFPHGLGHSLGIQVHDVGCRERPPRDDNPYLRTTAVAEPGMVFTVEPGCYFIDELLEPLRSSAAGALLRWGEIDRIAAFGGIRIEDNVLVTAEGNRNLTRDNWVAGS